jgi:S1-C subfamily serine protease
LNSELEGDFNFSDFDSSMVFISKEGDFQFNEDDINIHFPESLKDLNIFISDGKSTSKLLGKRHKFSSISDDLSKYFGTKDGVLVLSVDDENVFGLKDGDVIKKVNGNDVISPKSIIKELLKAEEQDKITLKIVRHKKNKTLKSN